MKIEHGSRMIVEFSNKERMNCRYVGQSEDEFVLLKVPMVPGIRERMAQGTFLQFRYLHDGKLIGFGADVLRFQASPTPLVFLSYPKEFSEHNLRQEGRVECRFPTTVAAGGETYTGYIVDISPSGCRFKFNADTNVTLNEDAVVSGSYTTMEGKTTYKFKGEVKASDIKSPSKWLGIMFEKGVALPEGVQAYFDKMADVKKAAEAPSTMKS